MILVVYEFEGTIEHKQFENEDQMRDFINDDDESLCQDGDFVKYFVIKGDFELTGGVISRV